jgi:hypothetical protein
MPTNPDPDPEDIELITSLGFKYTNKLKLLGVDLSNKLDNIDDIFKGIKTKIVNLVAYWDRFRLSLPGQIMVAKTFLVSQLNYIGSFLKPLTELLDQIQVIIDNFVKKNLNIASNRISKPTDEGGLGMFNLEEFLASQRCLWLARAHRMQIDNWRYDLKNMAPNNNILLI